MKLPNWYTEYKDFIEKSIERYLKGYLALPMSAPLEMFKEVVLYGNRGGKKLRAILALEFYLSLTGKSLSSIKYEDDIVKLCIALEIMHAFSLIHDDLPCMDNDELRRGEATVWKKYGEFQAVLVGDMMNCLSFELISDIKDPKASQSIAKLISHSVGYYGMVGGQVEDMYYEHNLSELNIETLQSLHAKKTGKLIEASITAGCILSEEISNLDIYGNFGRKLGLAFQVKDDILDVEGTPEETGKSVGGEQKGFVYLVGLAASKKILADEIIDCKKIAETLGSKKIDFLVDFVANRKK
ncbi:polyprenyl synthetase family protein [Candidatus Gracilibacteria bacterium]|nr:polyprenyl synthetase family protein [Candidatus Gracilibacteria bacterium]